MDKFEGALGKGKGRKWYAYKVMMTKVRHNIQISSLYLRVLCFSDLLSFCFLNLRNGSSFRGILKISEQRASPGRGRSRRWKVSLLFTAHVCLTAMETSFWTDAKTKNVLTVPRPLWVICCILLYLPAMDVWHEPRAFWLHLWTCGYP